MEPQAALSPHNINSQGRHNLFSIKPYKQNLLTPGANYWIICIHLVILVMATSEAIAWGYLGSLFGKGALGFIAAGVTFVFMFLIIWVIDVSFVTLDLSRSYYDKIILKKETERWVDNTRLGVGLLGRVAIVFVSLSISAPFLAQIVFKQDIDNEIVRRNMATVSMVSDSMLIAKDEQIAVLDSIIQTREAALITETAGKGSSGNYGFGPVTRAMEANINRLRGERADILEEKAALDQTAQSLTVDEFAALHNVNLINNGVRTREEILGGLMENPEYRTAKTAITAFLAFIFAALVLLKLFQPRSVRIYYNEKLQDLYREYLAGHLNKWISVPEQSNKGQSQMSPLRFEDWCVNTYSVVRNEDIKRRDSRKIYNLFKMKIEQLEEEKAEIKKMMEPVEAEYERAMTQVNKINIELLEAENQIQQNTRNGDEIAQQLKNISDDLKHHRFQGSDVLIAVMAKKEAEDKRVKNKNEGLSLQHKHDLINHRFIVKEADAKQVETSMAKIRKHYHDLQEKIDRERIAYTDLIVGGHVVDIPRLQEDLNPVDNLLSDRTSEDTFEEANEEKEDALVELTSEDHLVEDKFEPEEDEVLTKVASISTPDKPETSGEIEEDQMTMYWEYEDEPVEDTDEASPIDFVDDQQLNIFAEAASLANYEQEEAEEDDQSYGPEKNVRVNADYFVDPALITYNNLYSAHDHYDGYDAVGVDVSPFDAEADDVGNPESMESFNEDVQTFLAEADDAASGQPPEIEEDAPEEVEEFLQMKITGRANRTDRNGKLMRKGTFGKTFGGVDRKEP